MLDLILMYLCFLTRTKSQLQDLEAPAGYHVDVHTKGDTAFFKTCFNGLNAFLGIFSFLKLLFKFIAFLISFGLESYSFFT
ncbi:hypothetical protein DITRI_Ditri16bG0113700 [Diplodiscus trichospermus]